MNSNQLNKKRLSDLYHKIAHQYHIKTPNESTKIKFSKCWNDFSQVYR